MDVVTGIGFDADTSPSFTPSAPIVIFWRGYLIPDMSSAAIVSPPPDDIGLRIMSSAIGHNLLT
jgi:hypothetical protein